MASRSEFKSARRESKKGNRFNAPVGSNSAQFHKAETNKQFIGTRVKLHMKSKKKAHSCSSFLLNTKTRTSSVILRGNEGSMMHWILHSVQNDGVRVFVSYPLDIPPNS